MMGHSTTTPCMASTISADSKKRTRSPASSSSSTKKQVNFSGVSIRRFDVTCIGIIAHGPSIGLDWSYTDDCDSLSLDSYEQTRVSSRKQEGERGLRLSPLQRRTLLIQKHGYSPKALMEVFQNRIGAPRRLSSPPQRRQHSQKRPSSSNFFSSSSALSTPFIRHPKTPSSRRGIGCRQSSMEKIASRCIL